MLTQPCEDCTLTIAVSPAGPSPAAVDVRPLTPSKYTHTTGARIRLAYKSGAYICLNTQDSQQDLIAALSDEQDWLLVQAKYHPILFPHSPKARKL